MKKLILTACIFIALIHAGYARDYVCYLTIHAGVDQQLKENIRQVNIRNNAMAVASLEGTNSYQMTLLQKSAKKIMSRFSALGAILDAASFGLNAYPYLTDIIKVQGQIVSEAAGYPVLIPMAASAEVDFVGEAKDLIAFLIGVIATYGDINQMRPSDRKLLVENAEFELRSLDEMANTLLGTMRDIKMAKQLQLESFSTWINQDKDLMQDIIHNANSI